MKILLSLSRPQARALLRPTLLSPLSAGKAYLLTHAQHTDKQSRRVGYGLLGACSVGLFALFLNQTTTKPTLLEGEKQPHMHKHEKHHKESDEPSEGPPRHATTESPPHRVDSDGVEWHPKKIRKGGTLERTFRYYASYKCGDEVAMTPEDMMRSLSPMAKHPHQHSNEHIGEQNFVEISREKFKALRKRTRASDGTFFQRRPEDGPADQPYLLITFPEYHFFLTILSTAIRNVEVAFRMFDVNNNGMVSLGEFYRVMSYVRESSAEMFDRGGTTTKTGGQKLELGLLRTLFGVDKNRKGVSIQQFKEAVIAIRDELGKIEYEDLAGGPGEVMTERAFAVAMLSFIRSGKLKDTLMDRTEQLSEEKLMGWKKWLGYLELKDNISALEDALRMHTDAGLSVDKKTFQRAIRATNGEDLDGEVLDIIFRIFDDNGDGCLSHQEFVAVIKTSQGFGLKQPPNHQLKSGVKGLLKCWVDRMQDER